MTGGCRARQIRSLGKEFVHLLSFDEWFDGPGRRLFESPQNANAMSFLAAALFGGSNRGSAKAKPIRQDVFHVAFLTR
ncbi:hypothetical protein ASF69_10115 [Rhizobium sp. Leaf311]|nr:hypothetical protein ASF69_10115 [Rhizobium sp. Leaf311]